jgi:hypothetical protein
LDIKTVDEIKSIDFSYVRDESHTNVKMLDGIQKSLLNGLMKYKSMNNADGSAVKGTRKIKNICQN